MIIGIGVDRLVIARIERSLSRFGDHFIQRIYSEAEIEQSQAKANPARRFAMLFAAKEAVAKALGTGFRQGVFPCHIETIHLPSGKPEITLHAGAKAVADRLGIGHVHLSLSDDDGIAMAFAVAENIDNSLHD